jgi:hypothetical protein
MPGSRTPPTSTISPALSPVTIVCSFFRLITIVVGFGFRSTSAQVAKNS